jgi:anti-sigma factor RsiW
MAADNHDFVYMYIDNELSRGDRREFEKHLVSCAACSRTVSLWQNINTSCSEKIKNEPLSERFTDSVMDCIADDDKTTGYSKASVLFQYLSPVLLTLGVVLIAGAAIVAAGVLFGNTYIDSLASSETLSSLLTSLGLESEEIFLSLVE